MYETRSGDADEFMMEPLYGDDARMFFGYMSQHAANYIESAPSGISRGYLRFLSVMYRKIADIGVECDDILWIGEEIIRVGEHIEKNATTEDREFLDDVFSDIERVYMSIKGSSKEIQ